MPLITITKISQEATEISEMNTQTSIEEDFEKGLTDDCLGSKFESEVVSMNDNEGTNPNILFIAKRVMEHLPAFSYERRAFAQTCRDLRDFDKEHFDFFADQIGLDGQKGAWLSLELYYPRLLQLDLGRGQNPIDNSNLSIDKVRRTYLKIKERQAFEINHFLEGTLWYRGCNVCPVEFKDELNQRSHGMVDNPEPNLQDLEQMHNFLDKINTQIIQDNIDLAPTSKVLSICSSNLTRFPGGVIVANLVFFQALQRLDCQFNQLIALPESIRMLQALHGLDCRFNQLQVLSESIEQLHALQWMDCSNNQLKALPESIGRLQELQELDCHTNQLQQLPESLGSNQVLEKLNCSNNQLVALPEGLERFSLGTQNTSDSSSQSSSGLSGASILHSFNLTSNSVLRSNSNQEIAEDEDIGDDYADLSKSASLR